MNKMKHRSLALILLALAALAGGAPGAFAQDYPPVPVTISRSQVTLSGKAYYVHIVLERQTVFGITKAYGVTEEDLYEANPLLAREGLKAGSVIYIPVVPDKKPESKPVAAPVKEEKPAPVKEEKKPVVVDTKPAPVVNEDGFLEHTVKWFEDIYDVAKAYDVTAEQIMAANDLKSSRISKRQTLLIPVTEKAKASVAAKAAAAKAPVVPQPEPVVVREDPVVVAKPVEEVKPEVVVKPAEEVKPAVEAKPAETIVPETGPDEADDGILDWLTGKGSADIALILPFNAAGNPSESNLDFYSGVLLALRDLEKEGVKSTLNVFDLQAGVPSSADLARNDFVLGPITANDLSTILGAVDGLVPVVSPLDQQAGELADTRAGFIQAPSSAASQYAELAAWAAEDCNPGDKIILVTERVSGGTAPGTGVRDALVAAGTPFDGVSWSVSEGRSLPASLTALLTKGGVNRIIVASEKEGFVADIARNINIILGRGYTVAMYAPSKARTFESVDSSIYHQDHLHICSPYFADYDAPAVRDFVRTYRAVFQTEPSQFAFQGYDLTHFFAGLVSKYGNRWTRALTRVSETGLHTDFRFMKTQAGAFRNTGIRRIVYNTDYSTSLVR